MLGEQVGDYVVHAPLGQQVMASVYLGEHRVLGQKVTIKALEPHLLDTPGMRERFEREARVLAQLNHPAITRLHNFYDLPAGCFVVTDYSEGETLAEVLERDGPIPAKEATTWLAQVLDGLEYAHQRGIIHRDIKPSNLLLDPSGSVKILDFGLSKITASSESPLLTTQGLTLGTMHYMSREQLFGKTLDPRADVYSAGVTLYELLSGKLPFDDDDERRMILKITKHSAAPLSEIVPVPPALERVVDKAMAKDRAERYASAADMRSALLAADESLAASPDSAVPPSAGAEAGEPARPRTPAPAPAPPLARTPAPAPAPPLARTPAPAPAPPLGRTPAPPAPAPAPPLARSPAAPLAPPPAPASPLPLPRTPAPPPASAIPSLTGPAASPRVADEEEEVLDLGGVTMEMAPPPRLRRLPAAVPARDEEPVPGEAADVPPPASPVRSPPAEALPAPLPTPQALAAQAPVAAIAPAPPAQPAAAVAEAVASSSSRASLGLVFSGACLFVGSTGLGSALLVAFPDQQLYGALPLGMGLPVALVLGALGIVARVWPADS